MATGSEEASCSTEDANMVSPEVKEENLMRGKREEFKGRLEASLGLRHFSNHHTESHIRGVASLEYDEMLIHFLDEFRASGIHMRRKQALVSMICAEFYEELEEFLAANQKAMEESETFLNGQIKIACKDIRESMEVKLKLNPHMRVDTMEGYFRGMLKAEKERFQRLWSDGNVWTFSKKKGELRMKLEELSEGMMEAQRVHLEGRAEPGGEVVPTPEDEPRRVESSESVPAAGHNNEGVEEPIPGTSQHCRTNEVATATSNDEHHGMEESTSVAPQNSDDKDVGVQAEQPLLPETQEQSDLAVGAKRSHEQDVGDRSTIVVSPAAAPPKRSKQMSARSLQENRLPSLLHAISLGQSVEEIERMLSESYVTLAITSNEERDEARGMIRWLIDVRPADLIPILNLVLGKGCDDLANVSLTSMVEKMEQLRGFLPTSSSQEEASGNAFVQLLMRLLNDRFAQLLLRNDEEGWKEANWGKLDQIMITNDFSRQMRTTYRRKWKGGNLKYQRQPEAFRKLSIRSSASGIRVAIEQVLACLLSCRNYEGFRAVCQILRPFF